jgi:hypothetical protein
MNKPELIVTDENYFELAEAVHAWLSLNHEGQWSDTYRLLCRSKFNPGPMWSESRVESENPYFTEITAENAEQLMQAIDQFLSQSVEDWQPNPLGSICLGMSKSQIAKYLAQIGRKGGSKTSEAKARAARENGKLGGPKAAKKTLTKNWKPNQRKTMKMKTFTYKSDSEQGTVEARTLKAALKKAQEESRVTPAAIADGAWLWVEDPESGDRLHVAEKNMR